MILMHLRFPPGGPNEKDRQLLVDFHKVIEEYQLLDKKWVPYFDLEDACRRANASYSSPQIQSGHFRYHS